jgi:hypothetical protein
MPGTAKSAAHRAALSLALRGNKNGVGNPGCQGHSAETRMKMSRTRKRLVKEGKLLNDSHLEKIKVAKLIQWSDPVIREIRIPQCIENARPRRVWVNGPYGKKIRVRSLLEARVARWFNAHDIEWWYELRRFDYIWQSSLTSYTPDFYVITWDQFVEVKVAASFDSRLPAKFAAVNAAGYQIQLFTEASIEALERL